MLRDFASKLRHIYRDINLTNTLYDQGFLAIYIFSKKINQKTLIAIPSFMCLKYALSITHQVTRKSISGDNASFTMIKEQGGVYKGVLDNSDLHSELMVKAISENEKQLEI